MSRKPPDPKTHNAEPTPPKHADTVHVTHEMRERLLSLREETGFGPTALLRGTRHDRPDGLKSDTVKRWLEGKAASARKDHLEYVLSRWARLASASQGKVPLDEKTRRELVGHRRRTGVGPLKLLRGSGGVPLGLSANQISGWLSGRVMNVRKDHLDFVARRWAGLHPAKVSAWLSGQRTAKREHLEFVLARCREIWGEPFELSEINLSFACMEVICLQTEAFYALVEEVVDRVAEKHADKPDKWVGPEEAMRILRIKAKSTLQALRDEGKIRYSHPQKRIILYDRDSLLAYLEKNARETF